MGVLLRSACRPDEDAGRQHRERRPDTHLQPCPNSDSNSDSDASCATAAVEPPSPFRSGLDPVSRATIPSSGTIRKWRTLAVATRYPISSAVTQLSTGLKEQEYGIHEAASSGQIPCTKVACPACRYQSMASRRPTRRRYLPTGAYSLTGRLFRGEQ
jgi:hypothetical protein